MILSFNHTSFTVSNVENSVDFYVNNLGMKLISLADRKAEYVRHVTGIEKPMKIAYLEGYGLTLELIEYVDNRVQQGPVDCDTVGAGHICFNVDNINELVRSLKRRGIKFKGEPVLVPAGANKGGQAVYSLDPDGIVIEFIEPGG